MLLSIVGELLVGISNERLTKFDEFIKLLQIRPVSEKVIGQLTIYLLYSRLLIIR